MKLSHLLLVFILLIPLATAVTITDTTFQATEANYTIFIDSITLDNLTLTNLTIEFYNVSSVGSNLTNTNDTFDARADFYNLDIGLTIHNVNTSLDLFNSTLNDQDFNVTFTAGQVIRIISSSVRSCDPTVKALFNIMIIFLAIAIIVIPISLFVSKGEFKEQINAKLLVTVFMFIIIAIAMIRVIANSVVSYCGS